MAKIKVFRTTLDKEIARMAKSAKNSMDGFWLEQAARTLKVQRPDAKADAKGSDEVAFLENMFRLEDPRQA